MTLDTVHSNKSLQVQASLPQEILQFLQAANLLGDFYLVGGPVRDALLGRTPKDFDFTTTTHDSPFLRGMKNIGKSFPVHQTKVGKHDIEIAAARREKCVGDSHQDFEVEIVTDIRVDLHRRDFTIGNIAWSPDKGLITLDDRSFRDLRDGVIRHVSEAFVEDALRVFRAARFAAQLGFTIAPETIKMIQENERLRHKVTLLSPDRVREEMVKALFAPHPDRFFTALDEMGHLEHWFPEVHALKGCTHSALHHPEGDAFEHTMWVLRKAKSLGAPLIGMLGALTHDFGKALTPVQERPRYIGHETMGLEPVQAFCDRMGFGDDTARALKFCCRNHMHMHKITELRPSTLLKILAPLDRIKAHIRPETFALVCQSDHCGRGDVHWDLPYPQGDYLMGAMGAMQAVKVDPERLKKFQGDGEKIRAFVDAEKAAALKVFRTEWFKIK